MSSRRLPESRGRVGRDPPAYLDEKINELLNDEFFVTFRRINNFHSHLSWKKKQFNLLEKSWFWLGSDRPRVETKVQKRFSYSKNNSFINFFLCTIFSWRLIAESPTAFCLKPVIELKLLYDSCGWSIGCCLVARKIYGCTDIERFGWSDKRFCRESHKVFDAERSLCVQR